MAKALPRGVREKNGSYEARAVVKEHLVFISGQ